MYNKYKGVIRVNYTSTCHKCGHRVCQSNSIIKGYIHIYKLTYRPVYLCFKCLFKEYNNRQKSINRTFNLGCQNNQYNIKTHSGQYSIYQ